MSDTTPSELRRQRIDAARTVATRLLDTAKHETMKQQVRLATRDLDEAEMWLRQQGIDTRRHLLEIVDFTVMLATKRLEVVDKGLQTHGPGAELHGG